MKETVVEKVLFARELLDLSRGCFQTENAFANAAGIIVLQDAVEIFLLALADHVDANTKPRTSFGQYFDCIEEKVDNPLSKSQLLKLNQLRVDIKHHAFSPPHVDNCKHFFNSVEDFFEGTNEEYFGLPFHSISFIALLGEGEAKEHLKSAEINIKNGKYEDCLVNCRKAIYEDFESRYRIKDFEKDDFGALLCNAPLWARNKDYIEKYVNEPTDYIVYDYNHLDMTLLKAGIIPDHFWNVRQLTPDMFFDKDNNRWIVKHEFKKLKTASLKENAEYAFLKTTEIILKLEKLRRQVKVLMPEAKYLKLRRKDVIVYSKADKSRGGGTEIPQKEIRVVCDYITKGLADDDKYYHIFLVNNSYVPGFIHEDDVEKLLDERDEHS